MGNPNGNPNVEVQEFGQSFWYDNLSRDLIQSGELQRLVDEYGVLGVTSNPTIFEKAIGEGELYDEGILNLVDSEAESIFDNLAIEDIRTAADVLRPIYDRTGGVDGYISIEVSPLIADDTEKTLSEAKRLFTAVQRPNVMIKIPGTPSGLPAVEEALFAGININITLLFSIKNYLDVAERYIRALERRSEAGLPVDNIASVASFFLSRIDSVVDKQLENNIRAAQGRDLDRVRANSALLGKTAISNAKVAYKRYKDLFHSERFSKLKAKGARVQRLLWASTGTKNPAYSDTMYVENLIGQDTVNTMPPATLEAFKDHGKVAATLEQDVREAEEALDKLAEVGVELDMVTKRLQDDGVESFVESYRKLIARVEGKRQMLLTGFMRRQKLVLGEYQEAVSAELKRLRKQLAITRTWDHDATLWKTEPEHVASITNRLGWLTIATDGRVDVERLKGLRDESKQIGWGHVVLLGMGGSSLAPEVLSKVFGKQAGFPELIVLDSTDPEAILYVEDTVDYSKTLFIVASKSGTTLETLSMQRYFYEKLTNAGLNAGDHFLAITDPGSKLEGWAKELKFQHIFLNPADIGGRYSALSYFGMVPAALMGLDFEQILARGAEMQSACAKGVMGFNHPGLWLGTVMGVLSQHGKDKLTLIMNPDLESFGDWAEQLVAESTGKEGKGIIPVTSPTIGLPHDYSDDRLMVYMPVENSADNPDEAVRMLQEAGHPLMTLTLRDKFDVGAEFFRWEFATAVAGIVLQINPFDELNVTESKDNTNRLLKVFAEKGALPQETPIMTENNVSLYADREMAHTLQSLAEQRSYNASELGALLASFFSLSHAGDYIAVMAYVSSAPEYARSFDLLRRKLRHTFRRAVTFGYGPRFLHSTGQLHKGGANNGVFLQITVKDDSDPQIPDAGYGFSTLKQAQAAGDLESLRSKNRRVLRVHFADGVNKGVQMLLDAIDAAAEKLK
jgi:transaldolase / glucose-6-phosphate isomerase